MKCLHCNVFSLLLGVNSLRGKKKQNFLKKENKKKVMQGSMPQGREKTTIEITYGSLSSQSS